MKKVIYTCLVGQYDELNEPEVIDNSFDYICFSNDVNVTEGSIWQIKKIPYETEDNVLLSRYVKFFPHGVLSEYEVSIYIDANIIITGKDCYSRFNDLSKDTAVTIAIAQHPIRNCIYEEAKACFLSGKANYRELKDHIEFLRKEKFPSNYGLHENNIIYRRHNRKELISASNLWWDVYIKYSKRDQLSLEYIAWKRNLKIFNLFERNFDVRDVKYFKYSFHNRSLVSSQKLRYRRYRNKLLYYILGGYLFK